MLVGAELADRGVISDRLSDLDLKQTESLGEPDVHPGSVATSCKLPNSETSDRITLATAAREATFSANAAKSVTATHRVLALT
jgi:hypothetical protein